MRGVAALVGVMVVGVTAFGASQYLSYSSDGACGPLLLSSFSEPLGPCREIQLRQAALAGTGALAGLGLVGWALVPRPLAATALAVLGLVLLAVAARPLVISPDGPVEGGCGSIVNPVRIGTGSDRFAAEDDALHRRCEPGRATRRRTSRLLAASGVALAAVGTALRARDPHMGDRVESASHG